MLTKQRRGKNNNSGDPSLSPDVETARTFAFSLDNKKMKYSFVYKRGGEKKKKTHTLHRVRSHSRFIYENTAPGWKTKNTSVELLFIFKILFQQLPNSMLAFFNLLW